MDTSFSTINIESINDVLKSFYIVTKMRIVIFDVNYNKILSYPESDCTFCRLLQTNPKTKMLCVQSNTNSFINCKKTKNTAIYKCHAGLIEATAPLIDDNGLIHGYAMFGQISPNETREKIKKNLENYLIENDINYEKNDSKLFDVNIRNNDQIIATSNLLEMCTKYLILRNYINYQKESFIDRLNKYIDSHLSENLEIQILMDEFKMSRNALYEASKEYFDIGIAEYIKKRRIIHAKNLLISTNNKIITISSIVGFNDYNYFCRVFKKEVGIPAKKYRKLNKTTLIN